MSIERDLFGADARRVVPMPTQRPESNDMDLVQSVIRTATTDGYALLGHSRHAFRHLGNGEVERTPTYESNMVHQLIGRRLLTEGGTRTVVHGRHEYPARSVLVPKSTKAMAARWAQLVRLPAPRNPDPHDPTDRK